MRVWTMSRGPRRNTRRGTRSDCGPLVGRRDEIHRWRGSARAGCSGGARISEFYGIVIAMYYREHGVAHFHATCAAETVVVAIETGDVIAGSAPARALRLVQEW